MFLASSRKMNSSDQKRPGPRLVRAKLDLARAQMDLLIQEVSEDVDARMARNIEQGKREAKTLREMSELFELIMQIPVVEVAKSGITVLCKVIVRLAEVSVHFEKTFDAFVAEHGALLEDSVKDITRRFIQWSRDQERILAPVWDEYVSTLDRDLRESSDEATSTASDWSAVDADGLT